MSHSQADNKIWAISLEQGDVHRVVIRIMGVVFRLNCFQEVAKRWILGLKHLLIGQSHGRNRLNMCIYVEDELYDAYDHLQQSWASGQPSVNQCIFGAITYRWLSKRDLGQAIYGWIDIVIFPRPSRVLKYRFASNIWSGVASSNCRTSVVALASFS